MSTETNGQTKSKRVIKRYSNRKLYDTKDSRYVTLAQIAEMVRAGEDVLVLDNATREDKTEATLALILSEEVKSQPKQAGFSGLKDRLISQLRESPLGRLIGEKGEGEPPPSSEPAKAAPPAPAPAPAPSPASPASASKDAAAAAKDAGQAPRNRFQQTLDEWQAAMDERVKHLDDRVKSLFASSSNKLQQKAPGPDLREEVRRLSQRVAELEKRLGIQEKRTSRE